MENINTSSRIFVLDRSNSHVAVTSCKLLSIPTLQKLTWIAYVVKSSILDNHEKLCA